MILEGKDNAIDISVSFEEGKTEADGGFTWDESNSEQRAMFTVYAFANLILQGKIPAELAGAFIDMHMTDSVSIKKLEVSDEIKH